MYFKILMHAANLDQENCKKHEIRKWTKEHIYTPNNKWWILRCQLRQKRSIRQDKLRIMIKESVLVCIKSINVIITSILDYLVLAAMIQSLPWFLSNEPLKIDKMSRIKKDTKLYLNWYISSRLSNEVFHAL